MTKSLIRSFAVAAAAVMVIVPAGKALAASAQGTASATIVQAIGISAGDALRFGNAAPDAVNPGTVIVGTDGSRSNTGGVTLSEMAAYGAASFEVSGDPNATYTITLPASILLSDGGENQMTVDGFVSNPNGTGTLSGAGSQTINVGATLNVSAGQATGSYSGTFEVSVDYN